MRFQTNTAAAGNLRLPVTQRNNARRNSSRLPLMPHRALFVSQCHHFSPVIYFIAIAVFLAPAASAAVAAMPFLLLHLRSPHPPLFSSSTSTTSSSSFSSTRSFSLSHSLSLFLQPSHPSEPCLRTPSRSKLSTTIPYNTIPLSPHPPGETLLYISVSVWLALPLFPIRRSTFRFLFRSRCLGLQRHFDVRKERKREKKRNAI